MHHPTGRFPFFLQTPLNPVFLVELQTDKVDRNKSVSPSGDDILSDLKSCADCLKNIIQRETEELRY